MKAKPSIHEGERLLLLVRRSGKEGKEVAAGLDIAPATLSRLYKSQSLTAKVRRRAADYFGIPEEFFTVDTPGDAPARPAAGFDAEDPAALEERDDRRILALVEEIHKRVSGLPPGEERDNWTRAAVLLTEALVKKLGLQSRADGQVEPTGPNETFKVSFTQIEK